MSDDTVRRLLGPAAPEVGCDECFELIDVYVELGDEAPARMPDLAAHLDGCPACAEEYESLRALVRKESAGDDANEA